MFNSSIKKARQYIVSFSGWVGQQSYAICVFSPPQNESAEVTESTGTYCPGLDNEILEDI
jgi:hypothetical protein